MKRSILLVDDDLTVLLTLKAVLELHGFEVETAATTAQALVRLESATYHMVISDLRMGTEKAGMDVIRAARRQSYDPATGILTAYPSSEEIDEKRATNARPDSLLVKPLGTNDLVRQIEALLIRHADRHEHRQHNSASQQRLGRRSVA